MGLAGIVFAQLAVVVVGASLITGEFATGMIRTTLTATQGRLRVLAAKALDPDRRGAPARRRALRSLPSSIAQPLLHDGGYVAPAYPPVSLTDPGAARAVVGTGLLLTAYALLALGIGTILRHSGATIATGSGCCSSRSSSSARFRSGSRSASRSSHRSPGWRSSRRPTGC